MGSCRAAGFRSCYETTPAIVAVNLCVEASQCFSPEVAVLNLSKLAAKRRLLLWNFAPIRVADVALKCRYTAL